MAAPTPTTRIMPTGTPLNYGMRCTVALSVKPGIVFWEVDPQAFGFDGGEPTDTTNQFNAHVKTKAARYLYEVVDIEFSGAFNPLSLADIKAAINDDSGSITLHLPNKDAWVAYGYLRKAVMANKFTDGTQPRMNLTLTITNWDKTNSVEEPPIYSASAGTP